MTQFFQPTSLAEALEILGDRSLNAVPVAGCTDLMVVDHATGRQHPGVVNMLRIPELRGIEFVDGRFDRRRLEAMEECVGHRRLILDLSCAPSAEGCYVVATDRWRHLTDFSIDAGNLEPLAEYCCEFLIHATQDEGKCGGIDADLVRLLGDITPVPTTYAGGIRNMDDIEQIRQLGQSRLDYTVGSALDIFGGKGLRYEDLVALNRRQSGD